MPNRLTGLLATFCLVTMMALLELMVVVVVVEDEAEAVVDVAAVEEADVTETHPLQKALCAK
jgi:hypothetical protein